MSIFVCKFQHGWDFEWGKKFAWWDTWQKFKIMRQKWLINRLTNIYAVPSSHCLYLWRWHYLIPHQQMWLFTKRFWYKLGYFDKQHYYSCLFQWNLLNRYTGNVQGLLTHSIKTPLALAQQICLSAL